MQPQTSPSPKPVMDISAPPKPAVAPAPPQSVPVQRAPAELPTTNPPITSEKASDTTVVPKADNKPAPHKVERHTPAGLIFVTLLVMTGLSGIAILIYLNS